MAKGLLNVHVKERAGAPKFDGFLPFTVELEDENGNRKHLPPGKTISDKPYKIRFQDYGHGTYRISLTTGVGTGDPDYTVGDQEALFHQGWCFTDVHEFTNDHEDPIACDYTVALTIEVNASNEDDEHDIVFEITPIAPDIELADEPVAPPNIDIACATCSSLYSTPGTSYYHNMTWYTNCMTNPPCT